MKLDEQLFRNYNELHAMIKQCYRNVAILEAYKIIQKENQDIYASTQDISNHFIILMQKRYGKYIMIVILKQILFLNFVIVLMVFYENVIVAISR